MVFWVPDSLRVAIQRQRATSAKQRLHPAKGCRVSARRCGKSTAVHRLFLVSLLVFNGADVHWSPLGGHARRTVLFRFALFFSFFFSFFFFLFLAFFCAYIFRYILLLCMVCCMIVPEHTTHSVESSHDGVPFKCYAVLAHALGGGLVHRRDCGDREMGWRLGVQGCARL